MEQLKRVLVKKHPNMTIKCVGLPCEQDICICVSDICVSGTRSSASHVCSWHTARSPRCRDSRHTGRKGSTGREEQKGNGQLIIGVCLHLQPVSETQDWQSLKMVSVKTGQRTNQPLISKTVYRCGQRVSVASFSLVWFGPLKPDLAFRSPCGCVGQLETAAPPS